MVLGLVLQQALGPLFLGAADPDYAYLFNSIAVTQGLPIGHTDHPGTPIQMLGAVIILFVSYLRNHSLQISDVIKNPELYLNLMEKTLLFLNFTALLFGGVLTFRITHNRTLSFFVQLVPFFTITTLSSPLLGFSPEPLLLTCGILITTLIALLLYKQYNKYFILPFSLIMGLGVATKVIFFPVIFIPLIILPKIKPRITFLLGAIFSFYLFTEPIVDQYTRVFSWINALFSHSGRYGTGENTVIDSKTYIPNLLNLVRLEPAYILIILVGIAVFLISLLLKSRITKSITLDQKILFSLVLTEAFQLIMVAKHPSQHYLISGMVLGSITVYLIFRVLNNFKLRGKVLNSKAKILILIILTLFPLLLTASKIYPLYQKLIFERDQEISIYNKVKKNYSNDIIITYFRSASPEYALRFGNNFAFDQFTPYLNEIYPNVFFWDIWNARFDGWDSTPIDFNTILAKRGNNKIIFFGSSFEKDYPDSPNYKPKLPLTDVYHGSDQTIYLLDTDKLKTQP